MVNSFPHPRNIVYVCILDVKVTVSCSLREKYHSFSLHRISLCDLKKTSKKSLAGILEYSVVIFPLGEMRRIFTIPVCRMALFLCRIH